MANSDEWWMQPSWLLAVGAAVALILVAAGWALSHVLPAIGAAIGYVVAGAMYGTISGVGGWFAAASLVGASLVTLGTGAVIVIKVVTEAAHRPFYPLIAVLAVLQTFLLDLSKELWPGEPIVKLLFKTSTALLFAMASALWVQEGWLYRICAVLLFLLLPSMLIITTIAPYHHLGFMEIVTTIDPGIWYATGGFLVFVLAAIFLGEAIRGQDSTV
jgi:hypothetical protein